MEWEAYVNMCRGGAPSGGSRPLHGGRINKIGLHKEGTPPTLSPLWETLSTNIISQISGTACKIFSLCLKHWFNPNIAYLVEQLSCYVAKFVVM